MEEIIDHHEDFAADVSEAIGLTYARYRGDVSVNDMVQIIGTLLGCTIAHHIPDAGSQEAAISGTTEAIKSGVHDVISGKVTFHRPQ